MAKVNYKEYIETVADGTPQKVCSFETLADGTPQKVCSFEKQAKGIP